MAGNFIGLWIVYFLLMVLASFGLTATGLQGDARWNMLALSALFALLTCVYLKLTEIRGKQKELEQKLDALLERQGPAPPDKPEAENPEAENPEQPRD